MLLVCVVILGLVTSLTGVMCFFWFLFACFVCLCGDFHSALVFLVSFSGV